MTLQQLGTAKTGNVGEAPLTGVSRVAKRLICLILALICALWITPFAQAADALGTMTDDITDPQNLLGSNVFAVTDKVKQTKADTGVIVRLLYVDSFGETAKPVEFVTQVLESVNPKPNTVLLAVASGDGSLVVASSSNSDEWLRKESTIDALSNAAYDKLATSGEQDWSGAAIAMMDEIAKEKKTDTSSTTAMVGVIGLGATLVALVAVIVVAVMLHRRKARKGKADSADDEEAIIEESLESDESQTADSQRDEASEPIEQSDVAPEYAEQYMRQSVDQSSEEPAPAPQTDPHESD
ncbi:TPM domain-containing protein [Bifidobacterium panos]|uniref:TPM domain-containing protein n=1 Tax=Bifidobacterium panos TaxID=2675321 RepID=A0ABX1T0P6_9BIFI|nr:TPM domain-containing protein [Bifidobacterium sp. DSM 109963]NMN02561.1 hypothetical protein [Bifidobacterium sp. DSM 109963]